MRDWIEQLAGQGYLAKEGEHHVLKITERGWNAIRGHETPRLLKPTDAPRRRSGGDSWDGVDRDVFDALRALRRELAEEKKVPAYIVFGDAALRDMARRRPSTIEGFLEVNGVGETKARQYGEAFLAAIREVCRSRSLELDVDPDVKPAPKPLRSRKRPQSTVDLARPMIFARFDRGESMASVADAVGKPPGVVLTYLVDYIREKKLTSPEPWVDDATFRRIGEIARETGIARPMAILKRLDGAADYDQVEISIACLQNAE